MINYALIAEAEKYYQQYGFELIDVPWIVSRQINSITMPADKKAFVISDVDSIEYWEPTLVGSAEQSFMQMAWDGNLHYGRYVATTPCFRDENDKTHFPYFMKVELFDRRRKRPLDAEMLDLLDTALLFFRQYKHGLRVVKTADGCDIETESGLEIGSYGIRYHPHIGYWIYGTGLALPRFEM